MTDVGDGRSSRDKMNIEVRAPRYQQTDHSIHKTLGTLRNASSGFSEHENMQTQGRPNDRLPPKARQSLYTPVEPDPQTSVAGRSDENDDSDISIWSRKEVVRGSRPQKYIYHLAPFEVAGSWTCIELEARFDIVQYHLATLVDRHLPYLDSLERRPTYLPRMTGTSPSDVRPSVVITCQDRDFNNLRGVFRSRGEKALNLRSGSSRAAFGDLLGRRRSDESIPQLHLCYRRIPSTTPTVNRRAGDDITFDAYVDPNQGYCGSLVRYGKKTATLGPPILVEGELMFLTVRHLFQSGRDWVPPRENRHSPLRSLNPFGSLHQLSSLHSFGSLDLSSDKGELTEPIVSWEDDDEYLDLDTEETLPDEAFAPTSSSDKASKIRSKEFQSWTLALPATDREVDGPYMDWGLVRPLSRSNVASLGIRGVSLIRDRKASSVMSRVRLAQPTHLKKVCLVSGVRGIIYGRILEQESYLPSFPHRANCVAWSVVLDNPSGLADGECGSVVVDEEFSEVYGHVVGCDTLGIAYVVPLRHVLKQIKVQLGTTDVGLLDFGRRLRLAMGIGDTSEVSRILTEKDVKSPVELRQMGQVLLWAAKVGSSGVIRQLRRISGLDMDIKDSDGRTPLSWAAEKGHSEVVYLLLDTKKVNPLIEDYYRSTPAYAAVVGDETIPNSSHGSESLGLGSIKAHYGEGAARPRPAPPPTSHKNLRAAPPSSRKKTAAEAISRFEARFEETAKSWKAETSDSLLAGASKRQKRETQDGQKGETLESEQPLIFE